MQWINSNHSFFPFGNHAGIGLSDAFDPTLNETGLVRAPSGGKVHVSFTDE